MCSGRNMSCRAVVGLVDRLMVVPSKYCISKLRDCSYRRCVASTNQPTCKIQCWTTCQTECSDLLLHANALFRTQSWSSWVDMTCGILRQTNQPTNQPDPTQPRSPTSLHTIYEPGSLFLHLPTLPNDCFDFQFRWVKLWGHPATLSTCPLEVALMMCWETEMRCGLWMRRCLGWFHLLELLVAESWLKVKPTTFPKRGGLMVSWYMTGTPKTNRVKSSLGTFFCNFMWWGYHPLSGRYNTQCMLHVCPLFSHIRDWLLILLNPTLFTTCPQTLWPMSTVYLEHRDAHHVPGATSPSEAGNGSRFEGCGFESWYIWVFPKIVGFPPNHPI